MPSSSAAAASGPIVNRARQDAERLRIAFEASIIRHEPLKQALTGVAEGWMADVVREANRFQ